jgi:hypothetical protein
LRPWTVGQFWEQIFFFFGGMGFELRAYTLSHSTSIFDMGFRELTSAVCGTLAGWIGFWSLSFMPLFID